MRDFFHELEDVCWAVYEIAGFSGWIGEIYAQSCKRNAVQWIASRLSMKVVVLHVVFQWTTI